MLQQPTIFFLFHKFPFNSPAFSSSIIMFTTVSRHSYINNEMGFKSSDGLFFCCFLFCIVGVFRVIRRWKGDEKKISINKTFMPRQKLFHFVYGSMRNSCKGCAKTEKITNVELLCSQKMFFFLKQISVKFLQFWPKYFTKSFLPFEHFQSVWQSSYASSSWRWEDF